jgi:hypothetical protein
LSLLELTLSVFVLCLDVLYLGLLFFFGVSFECVKISLSFDDRLVKVNTHLVFLVHALGELAKHDDPLLSLPLLELLHLFAVSLRLHQLELLLNLFLFVCELDLDILVTLSFLHSDAL